MFIKNKRIIPFILVLAVVLLLFSLSSVSAASFNSGHSSSDIQNFINTGLGDDEIVLEQGDYIDTLYNLNVSRKINIKSNGQVNIKSSTGGNLFNITARNVQILNLNISGYQTAIHSNTGGLSIIGNNITTTGLSIDINGSGDLSGISLENNTIISSASSGAFYVTASSGSTVGVSAKNNNITDNTSGSQLVRFIASECDNSLFFDNNNITGAGMGVYLIVDMSSNTLNFTNNNITGITGLFCHMQRSNNTVNFSNNNISGNMSSGVYMNIEHCNNNTINFTNNNITGGNYGVVLDAMPSNNTINFTNNNITGGEYGVRIAASGINNYLISNSNISFTNNNIKGDSFYGIELATSYSNSNIKLVNNNISGYPVSIWVRSRYSNNTINYSNNNLTGRIWGMELYLHSSNNTVNVSYNNMTGNQFTGVQLEAYNSNNTINFANNNITGNSGVWLEAYRSNNSILSFIGNNITGYDHTMEILSFDQFSGLSLLNNTFKSDNIGLYFWLNDSVVSDILVKGNTIFATNKGITFRESGTSSVVNVTVNYNRIIAPVGLDFTTTGAGSNFDYNWWGINDISSKVIGFDTSNHYILNITNLTSLANVRVGDKVDFALLVLNTTLTNVGVENMPYFVITGLFNSENYNSPTDDWFVHQFTVLNVGVQTLDALLDEQYVFFEFNASKGITNSTIVAPDNASVGNTVNITGIATDQAGNPLANTQITVTVDGIAYNVTTDSNGLWTLPYVPTRTGNVNVSVYWEGNNLYNGFTNSTNFNVKINTHSTISANNSTVGKPTIISGVATDEDGHPLANTQITVTVDGKDYSVTTNSVGEWSLTYIPTKAGDVTATVKWDGNSTHNGFTNSTNFFNAKINTHSTITGKNTTVGKPTTITGIATDEDGNPLANTKITVTIDGKDYSVTTNNAGEWSLTYTPTKSGSVITTVKWDGNSTHNGFTNSTSFNVAKRNIIVTLTVEENDDGSITIIANATYEDDGSPASDYPVEFILNGKIVGTGITDEKGIAILIIPANKVTDGPHTITVNLDGGERANNATASIEFIKTSPDSPDNETNKTSNNPAATAAMKKTGIPIPAILILLNIISLVAIRKKQKN